MSTETAGALVQGQSWSNKAWHKLGFFGRFDNEVFNWRQDVPKGGDLIHVTTKVTLSWADRIRILISGTCELLSYTKTTVEVGPCETRSEFRVLPPGY